MNRDVLIGRTSRDGLEGWYARPHLIEMWKNMRKPGQDAEYLFAIEGFGKTKHEAIMQLRYNISRMTKELQRQKVDLDWKIGRLEEMEKESFEKSMNCLKFKQQKKKNKVKV